MSSSEIREWYVGKNLFVTGGSGFMGRVLVEKILRTIPDIGKVYLLIRPGKKLKGEDRLTDEIWNSPLFDALREQSPELRDKLQAIEGDVTAEDLGMSDRDKEILVENMDVCIHCAATVNFSAPLKESVAINVLGVRSMLQLCREAKKLQSIVHVSTAYANCDKKYVEEKVYDLPFEPNQLIDSVSWMTPEMIEDFLPRLLGKRPNTYTLTKATAERLIKLEATDLPIAIIRPSIVGCTRAEPMPGWVDTLSGCGGLFVATGKGALQCMQGNVRAQFACTPVDVSVAQFLAVGWRTATCREGLQVYHNSHSGVTWGKVCEDYMLGSWKKHGLKNPVMKLSFRFVAQEGAWKAQNFLRHKVPAIMVDLQRVAQGKGMDMKMSGAQKRLEGVSKYYSYFTSNGWDFNKSNTERLWSTMSAVDRELFNFNMEDIDWEGYIETYVMGLKKHMFGEPLVHPFPSCTKNDRSSVIQSKL